MNTLLRSTGKIALTTGMICVIGWGVITFSGDPQQPTKVAEADISFGGFTAKSKHQKIVSTLMKEGFEKPRAYDWNGNKFFFTLKHTRDTPIEATRNLMESFQREGVNKKVHMNGPKSLDMNMFSNPENLKKATKAERDEQVQNALYNKDRLDDFFNGGIVPFKMSENYASMSGTKLKKAPKDGKSINMALQIIKDLKEKKRPDANIDRLYNLEAFRSPGSQKTTMTAMWSQENVDLKRYNPKTKKITNHNKDIPTCDGCDRTMSFRAQKQELGYANNVFHSKNHNSMQAQAFYKTALGQKGWKRADATEFIQKAQDQGLMPKYGATIESYARGKDFITVMTHPSLVNPGSTVIQVMESR